MSDLGMKMDEKLNFSAHIKQIMNMGVKTLGLILRIIKGNFALSRAIEDNHYFSKKKLC